MQRKSRSLGPILFVAGLVAGWSGGCSRSGSANVDLKKAREALAKRRADYGESRSKPIAGKRQSPSAASMMHRHEAIRLVGVRVLSLKWGQ